MDISNYLTELLRLHECVIVPDFGGFISNYKPAQVDFFNNSFSPPRKDIVFNSKLSKNDGLLTNYISETDGIGYYEARQYVSEFVAELWAKLESGENVAINGIGSFHIDKNGKLIFEPRAAGNLLLDVYGMEPFVFENRLCPNNAVQGVASRFEDKDAVRVVFKSRRVKQLMVGIPIIIALILMPLSRSIDNNQKAWLGSNIDNTALTVTDNASPVSGEVVAETENMSDAFDEVGVADVDSPFAEKSVDTYEELPDYSNLRYHIITGSFRNPEIAKMHLADMRSRGHDARLLAPINGWQRVAVSSYVYKSEAIEVMKILKNYDSYSQVWICYQ